MQTMRVGGGEHERLSGRTRSGCWVPSTAGASGPPRRGPSWSCSPSWWSTATARRTPGSWPSRCRTARACAGSAQIARRHRLVLCVGLSEKERDIVYNTQVLVGPDGYIGKQRKLHLSRDEVLLLQGRPGDHRLRHRPVQGRHRHLLRQPVPRDRPGAGPARGRGAPDAARRPLQAVGRHAGKRGGRPPLLARVLPAVRPAARENACFAVLTDQVGRAGYVDACAARQREPAAPRRRRPDLGSGRRTAGRDAGGAHPGGDDRGDARRGGRWRRRAVAGRTTCCARAGRSCSANWCGIR